MTHLAVVLVAPEIYDIEEAWLVTKDVTEILRTTTKSKYIKVNQLRRHQNKEDIKSKLNDVAIKLI